MQFTIRSIDKASSVSTVTLDASSKEQALRIAAERGLRVVSIKGGGAMRLSGGRSGRNDFPLGQFSQELLTLLNAGLALVESIETLSEKETHPARRPVLAVGSRKRGAGGWGDRVGRQNGGPRRKRVGLHPRIFFQQIQALPKALAFPTTLTGRRKITCDFPHLFRGRTREAAQGHLRVPQMADGVDEHRKAQPDTP